MLKTPPAESRQFLTREIDSDLCVVGGGMAGTCCAITAARAGLKVTLIQDRPVLGGNASSEVRLWVLGATSHMGNNNRWAREGGVIDELLVENTFRNPEGNPLIFDTVLLEKVVQEPNITLLLNTALIEAVKSLPDSISSVSAFCSQNSTMYRLRATYYCDASGDGVLGFLSGAAFRMGAESTHEFGEKFAPDEDYGELLGHSIYFYSKDVGRPVQFVPPSFALDDITKIPRYRSFNTQTFGCRLWWIEYGGRLDTVHETETIKWELWKVVYGVWNHIKNSGEFPDAENLTLEWVGHIPGKRESRRFEGDYMLRQQDLVELRQHYDAVAFGGWSIDLHPADGVFSEKPGCNQKHARGTFQIPYRCLYSRNIDNLFLAGRAVSASHVAFGSTRVMATCAHAAQAAGMAAAICQRTGLQPGQLSHPEQITGLQRELLRSGQHIPGFRLHDPDDLAQAAEVSASSTFQISRLPAGGPAVPLKNSWAQMLPVPAGPAPAVIFTVDSARDTTLTLELRSGSKPDNYTPDLILASQEVPLQAGGQQQVRASFDVQIPEACYLFYCLKANEQVTVHCSPQRLTGILSVKHAGTQQPADDGTESFEMWRPERRPGGCNLAVLVEPPLNVYQPRNVLNRLQRPTAGPNAWAAEPEDPCPELHLSWKAAQQLSRIELSFDTDYDHPMESVLMGHPERAMPFCVKHYQVFAASKDGEGGCSMVAECTDNHQSRNTIVLCPPVTTGRITIRIVETHGAPAALFEVRCY